MIHRRSLLFMLSALPVAGILAGCATVPRIQPMTGAQQSLLDEMQNCLNNIRSLRARFAQIRNNEESSGTVYMHRPGQLRLQYDPPSANLLVANNGMVVFADLVSHGTTSMHLARTPLSILLAPEILFGGAVTVVDVHEPQAGQILAAQDAELVSITLRSTAHPTQGTLTFFFMREPMVLQGLQMIDARGNDTMIRLVGTQMNVDTSEDLFQLPNT